MTKTSHEDDTDLLLPRGEHIDYELIEPGIRDLCQALNSIPSVHTLYSCEGHRPSLFEATVRPSCPFVIFQGKISQVQLMQSALTKARLRGDLNVYWIIHGAFVAIENGPWQWTLAPEKTVHLTMFSTRLQRQLRCDIRSITDLLQSDFLGIPE